MAGTAIAPTGTWMVSGLAHTPRPPAPDPLTPPPGRSFGVAERSLMEEALTEAADDTSSDGGETPEHAPARTTMARPSATGRRSEKSLVQVGDAPACARPPPAW